MGSDSAGHLRTYDAAPQQAISPLDRSYKSWKASIMLRFKTALITAITFILPSILLSAETAQGKDNPVPKLKLRVQVTGISGDGLGGSIDAFGSDQVFENVDCLSCGGGVKGLLGPLIITKDIDSASPKLLNAARTGSHISQVRIDLIRKNPLTGEEQVYFSALLTDVQIASFRMRVADQRDPQSLQGATLEEVGLKANTTQFFYLQSDGTLLNASNITPDALSSR
jgi:type VI protein secretion system component Hcp